MTEALHRRLSPVPTLLSLAPELLPQGTYSHAEALQRILTRSDVDELDLVSYQTTWRALDAAGILASRPRTRILIWPPDGCRRADVEVLARLSTEHFELRQVDRNRVPELVHLKLIILRLHEGRQFAITGSANYTSHGILDQPFANSEFSVLFEIEESFRNPVTSHFELLWDKGSQPAAPADFMREVPSDEKPSSGGAVLLPFQQEALRQLTIAYQSKDSRGALLSLPTGAGKTVIATRFLLEHILTREDARVLWVAPHEELLIQGARTINRLSPLFSRLATLRLPDEGEVNQEQLASDFRHVEFWTLKSAYDRHAPADHYDVVVIDEAHFGASLSNKMLPGLRERLPTSFFLGLTGTPYRKHFEELGDLKSIFGGIVSTDRETVEQATDSRGNRVLPRVLKTRVTDTDYAIYFDEDTLAAHELGEKVLREFNAIARNVRIAKAWAEAYGPTLVFAVSVEHANNLAKCFVEEHPNLRDRIQVVHTNQIPKGVPSRLRPADGRQLSRAERHLIHELFLSGEILVLISMNIYTMGVDFPKVETLFMARPTLSPVLYGQMVGRGLRGPAFGGTDTLTVVDFVDQWKTHEHLASRMMEYNSLSQFEEMQTKALRELRDLAKRKRRLAPADVMESEYSSAGVYRVTHPSGTTRSNRNWNWVLNVAAAVKAGRCGDKIARKDVIELIMEDDRKKGGEIAGLLRRQDNPST